MWEYTFSFLRQSGKKRHCIRQMFYYREIDAIVERELKIRLRKKYLIL